MAPPEISKARWWLFGVHAIGVSGLTALVLVGFLTTPPDAGANIGAGILLLPLLALGLPWSALFLINPYRFDSLSGAAWYVVVFAPAMVNVVIHAAVLALSRRRRRRRLVAN